MGKTKRSVLTLLALLVLLALAVGATGAAAQTVNTDNFRGKITAINAGNVTVANNQATMTFGTDANTEIHRNNQNATVADLRVGDSAKVEFFVDTLIAKSIVATGTK